MLATFLVGAQHAAPHLSEADVPTASARTLSSNPRAATTNKRFVYCIPPVFAGSNGVS